MATFIVTVAPVARPVTYAEARYHLRLADSLDEEVYVQSLIDAATDYAEERMATALMPRTIRATFYEGEPLVLPRGPLIEVVSVVDDDGQPATDYDVIQEGHRVRVVIVRGAPKYPIDVTYTAGFAGAAATGHPVTGAPTVVGLPASIRLAIMAHVGTMYENRESTTDKDKSVVPHSLDDFYRLKSRTVGIG
jgi:uncharacterized phiE125 gp8 family phage protein